MEKLGPVVKMYVGNLYPRATDDEVVCSLSQEADADILALIRIKKQQDGYPTRFAFINVRDEDVEKFESLNDKLFFGRKLIVKKADNQKPKPKSERVIPVVKKHPDALTVPQETPAMTYEEAEKLSEQDDNQFNR